MIAFHAHNSKDTVHPRRTYFSNVTFVNKGRYIVPEININGIIVPEKVIK